MNAIPDPESQFPVSVVMERRRVHGNRWIDHSWHAVGVTLGQPRVENGANPVHLLSKRDRDQYLWSGLEVHLHPDEAESYYHNLTVPEPGCYVLTRADDDGHERPVLVTLSFDAGQAYQEGEETVHSVPLPAPLYRAVEAFVLVHYTPEPRRKRKRVDWRGGPDAQA